MQPTNQYLLNLTPLRGIAAIWVVVFHFSEIVVKFVPLDRSLVLTKGYLMVDLFFIMSGFIMCHVYQQSFQTGVNTQNFRKFFMARFARIYPLHFFTLLMVIIICFIVNGWGPVWDPKAIPTHLLLLQSFGIHKIFTWNVPSWSLSAEWWAYMIFPFLVVFLYRKKGLATGLLMLFVVLAYLGIMFWIPRVNFFEPNLPHRQNLDVTYDFGYLRGLAGFISGMLLYKCYETGLFRKIFQKDITGIAIIFCTILSMHRAWNDGLTIILFAAIVFAFSLNNGIIHVICKNSILQYLGKISYSIYLMQMFINIPIFIGLKLPGLVYMKDTVSTTFWIGTAWCLVNVLIVIGVSSITYYTIENPCRKWINAKWGKQLKPAIVPL
jgi:peptidoglycan/LPS O-acetylase OafA/YrhL